MHAHFSVIPMPRRLLFTVLLCVVLYPAGALLAQPDLQLTRTSTTWPRIDIHFKVLCQGVHRVDMRKEDVRLFDDGSAVTDFTLYTPPAAGKSFSCAMLFDASGSMAGPYQDEAKRAGKEFIGRMDGVQDEAAVYWFTETLTEAQQLTTSKPLLMSAMDLLPASGGTAIWDAAYDAVIALDSRASFECRSIILLSDGIDNSSSRTAGTVVNAANQRNIRINFISLGFNGSAGNEVARLTGGKYFIANDPRSLTDIYRELFTDLRFCYSECSISYNRDCGDGMPYEVDVQLTGFCNGSDSEQAQLVAPLDIQTFRPLDISIGDARVQGGKDLEMTVWLRPPLDTVRFHPFSIPLTFDTSLLRLAAVTAPQGTVMHGVPLSITPRGDGALVTSYAQKHVEWTGPFVELRFSTRERQDTVATTVRIGDFWFEAGCLRSYATEAMVELYPAGPTPLVFCESLGPMELQWDRMSQNYLPNPFPVMARFLNTGSVEAKEARFILSFDSTVLRLRQPLQDTIVYAFADIAPGSHAAVSWDLETPLRLSDISTAVCIKALFDNHPPVECWTSIEIPRADGILQCSIAAPEIRTDVAKGRYEPMPFPVTVVVRNIGGRPADNVTVRLQLEAEMQLAAPDAPSRYQKSLALNPLAPGASDSLRWWLQHPIITQPQTSTLYVTAQSSSTAASSCTYGVRIPGLDLSTFAFTLIPNGPLTFCQGDSLVLDASSGRQRWLWNTGDSTRRITVRESGDYFCNVVAGGRSGWSDTVTVVVLPAPAPMIAVTGSLPLCAGDTLLLDAGEGYPSYVWNTGDSARHIRAYRTGWYWCDVRNEDGCRGRTDTLHVEVVPLPFTPKILRNGDMLTTDAAAHYQWYHDGIPIADSDNQFLQVVATGSYQVRITNAYGCHAWSDSVRVDVLSAGMTIPIVRELAVYPNPGRGVITIDVTVVKRTPALLRISDVLGRTVFERRWDCEGSEWLKLHLGRQTAGWYVLRFEAEEQTVTRTLLLW